MDLLPRRGARPRRIIPIAVAAAGALAVAPPALADTTVSIENGQFGSGLTGKHLLVRDTISFPFDARMDVDVVREGTKLRISDTAGIVHANGPGCAESGADARCDAAGVVGIRYEAGTRNDELRNSTNLVGVFLGNKGNDLMFGGSVRDEMVGQDGDDDAFGGPGPDVFAFEPGKDTFDGEDDLDTINYAAAPAKVSIQLDDVSANDGVAGQEDLLLDIEVARGSAFGDNIDGSNERNVLNGLGGNDHIRARADDDRMIGGPGADVLDGDDGLADTVDYSAQTAGVAVTIDDLPNDGNAQDGPAGARDNVLSETENVLGGEGNDNLNGHLTLPVANTLTGNGGDDTLRGRSGPDNLDGGADEDRIDGGTEADVIDGGAQADLVSYAGRDEDIVVTLDGQAPNDDGGDFDGPAGQRDDVRNMEGAETGDGNDHLFGSDGGDRLVGGLGVDEYSGGPGADVLETRDGLADQPISCGEGPVEPGTNDTIIGDVADLLANPLIVVAGDPSECELPSLS